MSAAASAFATLAPLLPTALSTAPPDSPWHHPSVYALLCGDDPAPTLSRLHLTAHHHTQRTFTSALFDHILDRALSPTSGLDTIARARLRAAAVHPSPSLFTAYYIPPSSVLTDIQAQFLYCHRLHIPLPFLASSATTCHPRCRDWPRPKPIPPDHALFTLAPHAMHQCACGATGLRLHRHDCLCRLIATTAHRESGYASSLSSRLCSSATKGTKVDVVLTAHHLIPPVLTVDCTVSCPLLPSYSAAAASSSATIFSSRASEKDGKHLAGCVALGRFFYPIVFTTLGGIGPPASLEWLLSLFAPSLAAERAAGLSGQATHHRRTLFLQSLVACLTRGTLDMVVEFTSRDPSDVD